jgi:hypothetical protein
MLAVLDNYQPHELITTALHFLDLHMPRHLLLPALAYLQKNKLTGERLADFVVWECQNSYVEFQRRLISALLKEPQLRLLAGRNFVT